VKDDSQEDFVVDDCVEDASTVSLIQLEEETVERSILVLDTQKGPGPVGISLLVLKKIVLVVKKPLAVLFNFSLLFGEAREIFWNIYFIGYSNAFFE
jgi:hypothetical protein